MQAFHFLFAVSSLTLGLLSILAQLMPSPKWKLVVDIGTGDVPMASEESSEKLTCTTMDQSSRDDKKQYSSDLEKSTVSVAQVKDIRIDQIIDLLGKFMPSDPLSPVAPYVSGFMSLRLLLLRSSRVQAEEDLVKTMLDSYSSYSIGGREESDIAVMLARDFMFLNQQPQLNSFFDNSNIALNHEAPSEPSVDLMTNSTGMSLFGLPSTSFSLENSPALTPIPAPRNIDALSIVSN